MSVVLALASVGLLAVFALALVRIFIGPSRADRILAIQLTGATTVGVLLLLSELLDEPALVRAALVFVLFAALVAAAFVRRPKRGSL